MYKNRFENVFYSLKIKNIRNITVLIIGIITNGILRCIGPQERLKELYGNGYHLFVNCHKERYIENEILKNRDDSNELMIREET